MSLDQRVQPTKSSPPLHSLSTPRKQLSHLKLGPSMHFGQQRPQNMLPTIPNCPPVHLLLKPLSLHLYLPTKEHKLKILKMAMNLVTRNVKMMRMMRNTKMHRQTLVSLYLFM
jgi:hypothetical protein